MSASDRGCVKTQCEGASQKIDLSERAVFDYFRLGKGVKPPENETAMCFHTASTQSGRRIAGRALRETTGVGGTRLRRCLWNAAPFQGAKAPIRLAKMRPEFSSECLTVDDGVD
jgi:hypothetical protein